MGPIPDSDLPGHKHLKGKIDLALETCQESQPAEFTASQPWETVRWKITRTALAMGNLRDGGIIVIGVAQKGTKWSLQGIRKRDLQTYDADKMIAQVNEYVSPHVDLTVVTHRWKTKVFVAVAVKEFDLTPLVCKKNREDQGLVEGGA